MVEYFGYSDINALRTALHRFPDDPVVKSAFYGKGFYGSANLLFLFLVKHNKVTQGLVNQGQCARDVDLYTRDGQKTNLFSQITAGQPLVIFAGSIS